MGTLSSDKAFPRAANPGSGLPRLTIGMTRVHVLNRRDYHLIQPACGSTSLNVTEKEGDSLETQLRAPSSSPLGRSLDLWSSNIPCADRDNTGFEYSRPGHPRNNGSQPVRRQRAGKARSGSSGAFVARRHRPRIETKSRTAAFEGRCALCPWTGAGREERLHAARPGSSSLPSPLDGRRVGYGQRYAVLGNHSRN